MLHIHSSFQKLFWEAVRHIIPSVGYFFSNLSSCFMAIGVSYQVWTPLGPVYFSGAFGELKIGLDGKIYVSKNLSANSEDSATNCNIYYPGPDNGPVPLPSSNYCRKGQFMQVIHEPNRLGMACNPEFEYLKLTDDDDLRRPGLLLQSDIKVAPVQPPDTIQGDKTAIEVCFRKEEVLTANGDGACYTWDDGGMERTRMVKESGTYLVSYFKDCSHQTDTFRVNFILCLMCRNWSMVVVGK